MNRFSIIGLLVLTLFIFFIAFFGKSMKEGFDSIDTVGTYPNSLVDRMLTFYPSTNRLGVSDVSSTDVWWKYPSFVEGSYKQITNNLKYQNNPDNGRSTPIEFSFALYDNNQLASNYTYPLPPATNCSEGVRVNYFQSYPSLMPFYNTDNILY